MKKTYETPSVEKIAFCYRDQVVVASGAITSCKTVIETTHVWNVLAERDGVNGCDCKGLNNGCYQTTKEDPSFHG